VAGKDTLSATAELTIPNNGKMCKGGGGLLQRYMIPIIVLGAAILVVVLFLVLRKKRKAPEAEQPPESDVPSGDMSLPDNQDIQAPPDYEATGSHDNELAAPAAQEPSAADWRDRTVILGPDGTAPETSSGPTEETESLPPEPETEEIVHFTLLKIDIIAGPDAGKVYAVDTNGTTIGRGTTNGIVVTDAQTSRQHARIYYHEHQFHIQDLQSRNGTQVNSVAVTDHVIKHNDTFLIGSNTGNFYLA